MKQKVSEVCADHTVSPASTTISLFSEMVGPTKHFWPRDFGHQICPRVRLPSCLPLFHTKVQTRGEIRTSGRNIKVSHNFRGLGPLRKNTTSWKNTFFTPPSLTNLMLNMVSTAVFCQCFQIYFFSLPQKRFLPPSILWNLCCI